MLRRSAIPTVVDFYVAPELGLLALLEAAIDITLIALAARYPENEPDAEHVPMERRAARGLVTSMRDVTSALHRYRLVLARARERDARDDLLPF